jgi:hypothetical protein
MYRRDGQPMQDREEGAAFFEPIVAPTEGPWAGSRGFGQFISDEPPPSLPVVSLGPPPATEGAVFAPAQPVDDGWNVNPWVVAGIAAVLGFGGTRSYRSRRRT